MTVRCVTDRLPSDVATQLGHRFDTERQTFAVEIGREYLVFGIDLYCAVPWVQISDDYEQISPVPLCLFELVDTRVPSVWRAFTGPDTALSLTPPEFQRAGFYEGLLEGDRAAVAVFRQVREQLLAE